MQLQMLRSGKMQLSCSWFCAEHKIATFKYSEQELNVVAPTVSGQCFRFDTESEEFQEGLPMLQMRRIRVAIL